MPVQHLGTAPDPIDLTAIQLQRALLNVNIQKAQAEAAESAIRSDLLNAQIMQLQRLLPLQEEEAGLGIEERKARLKQNEEMAPFEKKLTELRIQDLEEQVATRPRKEEREERKLWIEEEELKQRGQQLAAVNSAAMRQYELEKEKAEFARQQLEEARRQEDLKAAWQASSVLLGNPELLPLARGLLQDNPYASIVEHVFSNPEYVKRLRDGRLTNPRDVILSVLTDVMKEAQESGDLDKFEKATELYLRLENQTGSYVDPKTGVEFNPTYRAVRDLTKELIEPEKSKRKGGGGSREPDLSNEGDIGQRVRDIAEKLKTESSPDKRKILLEQLMKLKGGQ